MGPALITTGRIALGLAMLASAACGDGGETGAGGGSGATGSGGAAPGVDPFCATRPVLEFCEDFDEAPLPGRFAETREDGAILTIDEVEPASPPASLLAATVGEAPGTAELVGTFEAGSRWRLFLQSRMDALPGEGVEAVLGTYAFEAPDGPYVVSYGVRGSGLWFVREERGGTARDVEATVPVTLERWISVRLDVDLLEDGTGTATLRSGNDAVVTVDDLVPPTDEAAPTVRLGISSTGGAWAVRFDNVTVEVDG